MYLIIDNTYLPCQMRIHDDNNLLKKKKDIASMKDGVHEVIDGDSSINTFKKIKMKRLIYRAIELFRPEQILFEEKK